jgi:hypothetical protein
MWTLLKAPADWEEHKKTVARTMMVRDELVKYGAGPKTYPALVCSLIPPKTPDPSKHDVVVNSAYVYEADAEILLKAAGRHLRDPDAAVPPTQDEYNRDMAAKVLALIDRTIGVGLWGGKDDGVGQAAFEKAVAEKRELIDQYQTEMKAELRKTLAGYATTVLDALEPPR